MARQKRVFLFAILSLATLWAVRQYFDAMGPKQALTAKVKTTEQYWHETRLSADALEELLTEKTCESSGREFLACANAVLSIAQKYGATISFDGVVTKGLNPESRQIFAEKDLLAPWELWITDKSEMPKLSFVKIWRALAKDFIPQRVKEYAIGLGINAYLSVAQDPHTYILPADYYTEVVSKSSHKSASVGLVIGKDEKNYFIKKVFTESAAEQAGLKKGDIVLEINSHKALGMSPFEVTTELKGDLGTVLSVKVLRDQKPFRFSIVRSERNLKTVSSHVLEGIKPYGVLTINKFAAGTCVGVRAAIDELKVQGIRGLLLDLRDNPGGQMSEAACVSSVFLGPGKKVYEVKLLGEDGPDETVYTSDEQLFSGPVAVLVNSGSASAAEILAGSLQDHGRAVLVGERTFGKGSFQEGTIWSKNKKVAIFQTKGFYFLPSGKTPQMVGLKPDVELNFKDKFALRESEQYLYPLTYFGDLPVASVSARNDIKSLLPDDVVSCVSFESAFLAPEDPEIQEAHRILNCRGIAERGE